MPIFSTIDPAKSVSRSNTATNQITAAVNPPPAAAPQKTIVAEPANRQPAARRIPGRGAYSTPSIMDALRDEPAVEEPGSNPEVSTNQNIKSGAAHPFTQQEVVEAWKVFVEKIDAPQLKSALSAGEPTIIDEWQIEYEVDTELQLNRLALDLKPRLQGYLRQYFQNEAVEIQFKVSTITAQRSNIPYTDTERWALLVEKYPALATLKSKFGLDFEHF